MPEVNRRPPRTAGPPSKHAHPVVHQIWEEVQRLGMAGAVLEEEAGLSANHWWKIKSGGLNVGVHTLEALANVVGLTLVAVPKPPEEEVEFDA